MREPGITMMAQTLCFCIKALRSGVRRHCANPNSAQT